MEICYDKLWQRLDVQNIGREQLRKAAGLTKTVFVKIENNQSVQMESLIKLCEVLNCKMTDIIEIGYNQKAEHAIPNVRFDMEEEGFSYLVEKEYETLGYSSLYDFPIVLTEATLKGFLEEQYVTCRLSRLACKELIKALKTREVSIDFNWDLEPLIENLPKQISGELEDSDTIEIQQYKNYINWKLAKCAEEKQGLEQRICEMEGEKKQYYVEQGILSAPKESGHCKFLATSQDQESNVYPLSVLEYILGETHERDIYVYTNRIPDIIEYIETRNRITFPEDLLLFDLKIRKGLKSKDILRLLELPQDENFLRGIREASGRLWKLRRPPFCKYLMRNEWIIHTISVKECEERGLLEQIIDPYKQCDLPIAKHIYQHYVSVIKSEVTQMLQSAQDKSWESALAMFYPEEIVMVVKRNLAVWYKDSALIIDKIGLSWKLYHALKMCGVETVSQLLLKHGEGNAIDEYESSGLRTLFGVEEEQIKELLGKVAVYVNASIASEHVDSMIDYAEEFFMEKSAWPIHTCVGITHSVLQKLLELKYRDTNHVISDYETGELQERCKQQFIEDECKEVFDTVQMIATGKYPVTHIVFSDFWSDHIKNGGCSLQEMRKLYLQDAPMPYGVKEIESHIHMLFPGKSVAFRLLYSTRCFKMKWHVASKDVLTLIWKITLESGFEFSEAYWGEDKCGDLRQDYIYLKMSAKEGEKYALFCGKMMLNMKLIPGVDQDFLRNMYSSISFNAEICKKSKEDKPPRAFSPLR